MTLVLFTFAGFAVSCLLTLGVRRYALTSGLLDHPNDRSSHSIPTPRGGGVAIVASLLAAVALLHAAGLIERDLLWAIEGSGLLVAALGFADDRWHLAARWRFLGHALAAIWVLWWLGPVPRIPLFGWRVDLWVMGPLLALSYIVWSINLFNFMDGIDGIASLEAITVALGGALVWWLAGSGTGWSVALVLAGCTAGFLVWNFPPARIFMGDAGSGFLGLMVALLTLWCGRVDATLFWAWFILGGCFMVDATTTLVRRVRRGDKFHQPHRNHAYQYASRKHGAHRPVSLAVAVINIGFLLPMALLVALRMIDGFAGMILAYAPLTWLAFRYKAGARAEQET